MIEYSKNSAGYFEITAAGRITREDIDRVWTRIRADLPAEGKVKVLEIIGDLDGIEPSALWADLKLGLPMMHRVSHAAIVADQKWITALTNIADVFVSAEVKTFHRAQIEAARTWLTAA